MTREQYKKHKYLIEKWAKGAQIQAVRHADWENIEDPLWNINTEYRIAPIPEYIPFDYSDAEQLIGKAIKNKDSSFITLITGVSERGVLFYDSLNRGFEYIFKEYTFLDGSPCGKLSNF